VLDYLKVKKAFADKLASDADGIGRFESAFYHTMEYVYKQGVEDGSNGAAGIEDGRESTEKYTDGEIAMVVNNLRRVAVEYAGSQQLRQRLADEIVPVLRGPVTPCPT
jgi:hypothetical protein